MAGEVAVAVSGGTDSLMALVSLKDAGTPVMALHAYFLPPNDRRRVLAGGVVVASDPLRK